MLMRKSLFFLACVVALATAVSVTAQRLTPQDKALAVKWHPGNQSQVKSREKERASLPLFKQGRRVMSPASSVFQQPQRSGALLVKKTAPSAWGARSSYVPTLYANFLATGHSGFESFTPNSAATELLLEYNSTFFNGGAGIVDGKMCGIYFLNTGFSSVICYFAVDMESWEVVEGPTPITDMRMVATETATDPTGGTVFGQFYTADGQTLEFGTIDYKSLTRTTVCSSQHSYVAMGIAKDGFAYGVANDGNLYKIDRTNGTETLVGSTGVELMNANGETYYQSGEIDPKTNVFYWCCVDKDVKHALYTVNLSNGAATKLYDLEAGNIFQVVIPAPATADNAPASVENLTANFTDANLTGTVNFTMPTKTFNGDADLVGEMDWCVDVNGVQAATGKAAPGAAVTADVTATEGLDKIEAYAKNDNGNGYKSQIVKYVGYDQPVAPENVTLTADANRLATVTWTAPTAGTHNGYMGALQYNVYRITGQDTLKVATQISGTTCQDQISESSLKSYHYGVEAVNNTQVSAMAFSNSEIVGDAIEPPFFDDFLSGIDLYTVLDENNDNSTWSWIKNTHVAYYKYNKANAGDDWLMTPPLKLKAGKSYHVSFRASAYGGSFSPERIEAKWGNAPTAASMTGEITPGTIVDSEDPKLFENTITPDADGKYYIGFHAISDPNMFYLFLDSVSVEQAPEDDGPAAVTNLTATAAPQGALKATIGFNAPDKTIGGNVLSSITTIDVMRGSTVVKSLANVTPGSKQTVVDENAAQGDNTYTVMASNASGPGQKATVTVYVGADAPSTPEVKAKDNITSVDLSWNPVTGKNGGYVDPAQVTYEVREVTRDGYLSDPIETLTGKTQYTINGVATNEGEQHYMQWAVNATNEIGMSDWGVGAIIGGAPYTLPYHNSFKGATLENKFVGIEASNQNVKAGFSNGITYDNDGGAIAFQATGDGSCSMAMGKIVFAGSTAPQIMFAYNAPAGSAAKLLVTAERPDGNMLTLWEKDLSGSDASWQTVACEVPATLLGDTYDIIRFTLEATQALTGMVYLDNINMLEPIQKDASVTLSAPESIVKGKTANMEVKVTNLGLDPMEKAKVIVTVNSKQIAEETVSGLICSAYQVIPVAYKTSSTDKAEHLAVKAELKFEGDMKPNNNVATADIAATQAEVAPPTNLSATLSPTDEVILNWNAPESGDVDIEDDFESYNAWSFDLGGWTQLSHSNGLAGGIIQSQNYPHQDESWGFMNWQPSDYFENGLGLDPHSGTKSLVSIYKYMEGELMNSDDWLISPRLTGKAQTVSFWVNNGIGEGCGTESFDVLTSTTNTDIASFVKVGDTHVQSSGAWTEVTVEVPEGTKYFAIHHVSASNQAFIFMIDDAKFAATTAPAGYNVYRDGELIATVEETNYTDESTGITYQVTAVYNGGVESVPAEIKVSSGVNDLVTAGAKRYNVYTIDGRQVMSDAKSLKGLEPGIYIVNGKKKVIRK